MKTVLGISANGIPVYDATSIGGHVHPGVAPIISEVISKLHLTGTFIRETIDMGRVIGKDHLVTTNDNDDIYLFKRGKRAGRSRMVPNREAEDTQFVTIILCVATEDEFNGDWVVATCFEGQPGEREPWDESLNEEEKKAAEEFWSCHALVPTDEERAAIERMA